MEQHVTIYSTPTCHFCQLAKEFLTEKNIPFTNFNVAEDAAKREEMINLTGQLGVPVIQISWLALTAKRLQQSLASRHSVKKQKLAHNQNRQSTPDRRFCCKSPRSSIDRTAPS
jgi:glutaredoxin 3